MWDIVVPLILMVVFYLVPEILKKRRKAEEYKYPEIPDSVPPPSPDRLPPIESRPAPPKERPLPPLVSPEMLPAGGTALVLAETGRDAPRARPGDGCCAWLSTLWACFRWPGSSLISGLACSVRNPSGP